MANHTYHITRPSGTVDDIIADQVLFESHHLLFVDENRRTVLVLHADEAREIVVEFDEG